MNKVIPSTFFSQHRKKLEALITLLSEEYDYISLLGTDVQGLQFTVTQKTNDFSNGPFDERGFVLRIHHQGKITEYSFNSIPEEGIMNLVQNIKEAVQWDPVQNNKTATPYPHPSEDVIEETYLGQEELDLFQLPTQQIFEKLKSIHQEVSQKCKQDLLNLKVSYSGTRVCKLFLSANKRLEQSYTYQNAALVPYFKTSRGQSYFYHTLSHLGGAELLNKIAPSLEGFYQNMEYIKKAESVVPGEYKVILSPNISGLIAHESFGHGVELDMFIKGRAKAKDYINKQVGSALVNIKDGAQSVREVSSYFFDDEGNPGTDTDIVKAGIFQKGINDSLSASILGVPPTGNGKRESYRRKAYSRMTNTFFAPGSSTLRDLVKEIDHGYLIDSYTSGMEDPKNWGIQGIAMIGREIKDGEFTGKTVSPIVMTGSILDVLSNIQGVSKDLELSGSGYCGKGYKEFVKTSTGGPYIYTKMRLG